jgi:type III pantothenate kinase
MMAQPLLAVKVGNTNLAFGLFLGEELAHVWRAETRPENTADEYASLLLEYLAAAQVSPSSVRAVAVVSVVPALTETVRELTRRYFKLEPFVAAPGVHSGLEIKYDDPRTLGADRLVDMVAARARFGAPAVVVDFGTATTFNALDARGRFVGGAIAPGLVMSAEALHRFTAALPRVEIAPPQTPLARNTPEALRAGIFLGYAGLVETLVARIVSAMNEPSARVIATGGLAPLLAPHCPSIYAVDTRLPLYGLRILYNLNNPL